LPLLKTAANRREPARVVNIGSIHGLDVPEFPTFLYSATKAAVHHLTRHLAHDLAESAITVNALALGLFPTKMTAGVIADNANAGKEEHIVGTLLWLCSRAGSFTTGSIVVVDGGALCRAQL
jgi:NAD(P)-dependent dehydrogenase (short-subunit alcohol dehydrogenase family)